MDTVRRVRPHLGGSLMVAVCLVLFVRGGVALGRPYPSEDIQPLVKILEHELRDGDVVLLNDGAAFSFPLYTSWPIRLEPSPTPATGFYPRVQHRDVRRYESDASIPSLQERVSRVWLVTSHLVSTVHDGEQALSRRGFEKLRADERQGAALSVWIAPAPTDGLPAVEGRALTPGGNHREGVLHRWWRVAS